MTRMHLRCNRGFVQPVVRRRVPAPSELLDAGSHTRRHRAFAPFWDERHGQLDTRGRLWRTHAPRVQWKRIESASTNGCTEPAIASQVHLVITGGVVTGSRRIQYEMNEVFQSVRTEASICAEARCPIGYFSFAAALVSRSCLCPASAD